MNVKRFTARTSREALALVKSAFGSDAVVMSTRPCPEGVEVVAMASESVIGDSIGEIAQPQDGLLVFIHKFPPIRAFPIFALGSRQGIAQQTPSLGIWLFP